MGQGCKMVGYIVERLIGVKPAVDRAEPVRSMCNSVHGPPGALLLCLAEDFFSPVTRLRLHPGSRHMQLRPARCLCNSADLRERKSHHAEGVPNTLVLSLHGRQLRSYFESAGAFSACFVLSCDISRATAPSVMQFRIVPRTPGFYALRA